MMATSNVCYASGPAVSAGSSSVKGNARQEAGRNGLWSDNLGCELLIGDVFDLRSDTVTKPTENMV